MKKILLAAIAVLLISASFFVFDKQQPSLRIGMNAWPGYEYLYLAKVKGFYAEEGVNVEIIQYDSLEDVRFGYEQGQIDIMASTIIELLLTAERTGKTPQAFLIPDFSNGADVVVVNNSINAIDDLKNKNIAVEPESLGLFMLARTLDEANLKVSDVHVVGMSQQNMHQSMLEGTIDAAVTYPPVSVNLLKDVKGSSVVFDSSQIPGEVIDVIVADKSLIQERLEDFKAIVRAWDKTREYTLKNENDAFGIMAQREGISVDEFREVSTGMKVLDSKEQLQFLEVEKSVQSAIKLAEEVLRNSGYLEKTLMVDRFVNLKPLQLAYEK